MEADQPKRRGRPRKAVDEPKAIGDGEGATALGGADGQGGESDPGPARKSSPAAWVDALEVLNAISDDHLLTVIEVPFPDHPPHYERLHYGAVVVTGDKFSARTADGLTITL